VGENTERGVDGGFLLILYLPVYLFEIVFEAPEINSVPGSSLKGRQPPWRAVKLDATRSKGRGRGLPPNFSLLAPKAAHIISLFLRT
jgi:hypothetical protein